MQKAKMPTGLTNIPTLQVLILLILTIIVVYAASYYFRNNYDPKKLIITYAIYFIPCIIIGLLFHIKVVLSIGIYITGIFILVMRSNHYFYDK